ncbi:GNAT family N-acetyltransferase [Saccharicrinis sp. FJH54]|uniref:GNAT family N-acetyltransferase n=1 Tax=Saccharicrinis sp. FJH54 TaxID=3344665 RepID=UPI0035D50CCE
MEVKISRASLNNLSFLEALEETCFMEIQRSTRRMLRLSLNSPFQDVFLISVQNGTEETYAGAMVIHYHKRTLRLYSIAVLPQYRSLQLGKKLMAYCFERAEILQLEKVSLEAMAANKSLISWYEQFGFKITGILPDYYAEGYDAVKMIYRLPVQTEKSSKENIIVVDNPGQFRFVPDNIQVVPAKKYITTKKYQELRNARIFNLCSSYKYQSTGYYVSLLASARDHRVVPSVTTIGDFKNASVIKSISTEVDELIQKAFINVTEKKVSINIYFGQTEDKKLKQLAGKLYMLFETPLLQVHFVKEDNWMIYRVQPLNVNKLPEEHKELVEQCMENFFSKKRFHIPRLKNYKYDLAILVNPDEKNPPSNKKALEKFKAAADRAGFYMEYITKDDINRLSEFDALFIRETTNVNDYTYRFSRTAYAEGLVVIDDPWSILRCSNKIYLYERMVLNRIPIPASRVLAKSQFKAADADALIYPLVLKQPDGSFSKGVSKVHSKEELLESLKILFKKSELIIAQQFLPSEFDWRIGILDGQPLFACKYFMAKGHWQIYNWKGKKDDMEGMSATMPVSEVPEKVMKVALKGASLMGDGLYGVDLKEVNGEVFLIEINDNPNIDSGIEDVVLKKELYDRIMLSFLNRIELSRNITRFIAADPV